MHSCHREIKADREKFFASSSILFILVFIINISINVLDLIHLRRQRNKKNPIDLDEAVIRSEVSL
jgi:hypothetical protein